MIYRITIIFEGILDMLKIISLHLKFTILKCFRWKCIWLRGFISVDYFLWGNNIHSIIIYQQIICFHRTLTQRRQSYGVVNPLHKKDMNEQTDEWSCSGDTLDYTVSAWLFRKSKLSFISSFEHFISVKTKNMAEPLKLSHPLFSSTASVNV